MAEERRQLAVLPGFAAFAAALGFSSIFFTKMAIPAMFLMLIAYLTLPDASPWSRKLRIAIWCATPLVLFALVRFSAEEATPGIIEGGRRQQVKQALYHLRKIRFAQDMARQQAFWDPDGDGIGSAAPLDALSGHIPFRPGGPTQLGLLRLPPAVAGPHGDVSQVDGYAIAVFLPTRSGTGSARPDDAFDDERAERRWVAYAWPLIRGTGDRSVIYIDEHERILISDNLGENQQYYGLEKMPRFDAALATSSIDAAEAEQGPGQDGGLWLPWKDKKPRDRLPGDTAP